MARITIIGAGMAGLACARELTAAGHEAHVHEASDAPGGRMRTDDHDGFRLDRGFQVFLSGYEETSRLIDSQALPMYPFSPGALIRIGDAWHRVYDPFRAESWEEILATLRAPIGGMMDRALVAWLRLTLAAAPPRYHATDTDRSTLEWLRQKGFSNRIIDRFFRPFYGGIFLEDALATSSAMFRFTFAHFARGHAVLPAGGMGGIPAQLASRLPHVHYHDAITGIDGTTVHHADGRRTTADAVVIATDGPGASRWLPGPPAPAGKPVTCLYFSSPEPAYHDALVALNSGPGPIHNLAVLDRVAPGYAPPGQSLLSVTLLGHHDPVEMLAPVLGQLSNWFPRLSFQFLRGYAIAHALPALPPAGPAILPPLPGGQFLAGDHTTHPSIEGAVCSGLAAARAVGQFLGR